MRIYRLAEGLNADGWPFVFAGHAYLADGTPLTESDHYGRVLPALQALASKASCSGGMLSLADRRNGVEALARALDSGDAVRAPLLLLQLQIDPAPTLAKFNPFHKPSGPGGGQFASGSQGGGSPAHDPGFQQAGQSLNVDVNSTYVNGIHDAELDKAHAEALLMVRIAITAVGDLGFKPGMPGYGQKLDQALELLIVDRNISGFSVKPVYLMGHKEPDGTPNLPGSSVPDLVYGPEGHPLMIIELKTGRAARNISDAEIV